MATVEDDDEVVFVGELNAPPRAADVIEITDDDDNGSGHKNGNGNSGAVVGASRVGIRANIDYPHLRQHCGTHAYIGLKKGATNVNTAEKLRRTTENNMQHCGKCWCYVCDVEAANCREWSTHCMADDRDQKYVAMRTTRRRQALRATRRSPSPPPPPAVNAAKAIMQIAQSTARSALAINGGTHNAPAASTAYSFQPMMGMSTEPTTTNTSAPPGGLPILPPGPAPKQDGDDDWDVPIRQLFRARNGNGIRRGRRRRKPPARHRKKAKPKVYRKAGNARGRRNNN